MKNERLFKENEKVTLKKLEKIINKEIKDDIDNNEEDVNVEKWGIYPVIYLESTDVRDKILEFIEYIDEIETTKIKKISLILTVIYLIEKLRFDVLNIDINNVYLLVNYLENENINNLLERLNIVNDEEMLFKIRCFSLDISVRGRLLDYVLKNEISKEDFMNMILENSYYEVLERI